ncbi:MAG: hypothetical protein RLZZ436_2769 [Planctomycetota bacterium]|jgi:hypothetical protein
MLTTAEVNARLPLVRSIVRDALELHRDLQWRSERLQSLRERYPASQDDSVYEQEVEQYEKELVCDQQRFDELLLELKQIGGILTDPNQGTVDFPGMLEGRRIMFCWRPDETEVCHWHAGPCSQTARQPLVPATISG